MKTRYDDFSFRVSVYSYNAVESEVCSRCNIGYSNTSDLPMIVDDYYSDKANIHGSYGTASFYLTVSKLSTGGYEISIRRLTASR